MQTQVAILPIGCFLAQLFELAGGSSRGFLHNRFGFGHDVLLSSLGVFDDLGLFRLGLFGSYFVRRSFVGSIFNRNLEAFFDVFVFTLRHLYFSSSGSTTS